MPVVIRDAQVSALAEALQRDFIERMLEYAAAEYPVWCAARTAAGAREAVALETQKAFAYGITVEADVAKFVDVKLARGADCLEAEDLAWLRGILEDLEIDGEAKAGFVHEHFLGAGSGGPADGAAAGGA